MKADRLATRGSEEGLRPAGLGARRVEWDSWWRTRREDIRRPEKMIVHLGRGGWRCLLCGAPVDPAARADHHAEHMLELDEWIAAHTGGFIVWGWNRG